MKPWCPIFPTEPHDHFVIIRSQELLLIAMCQLQSSQNRCDCSSEL